MGFYPSSSSSSVASFSSSITFSAGGVVGVLSSGWGTACCWGDDGIFSLAPLLTSVLSSDWRVSFHPSLTELQDVSGRLCLDIWQKKENASHATGSSRQNQSHPGRDQDVRSDWTVQTDGSCSDPGSGPDVHDDLQRIRWSVTLIRDEILHTDHKHQGGATDLKGPVCRN